MCNLDLYFYDDDILSMLETTKLEDKLEIQEMKDIIEKDIYPVLKDNLNNGIPLTATGKSNIDHLAVVSAKILGTMYDDANIYVNISKINPKNETPTIKIYLGDLTLFNHAEYNSANKYIEQNSDSNEKCNIKSTVMKHVEATTDHREKKHCVIVEECTYPDTNTILLGHTITTNPVLGKHAPVAFYYGNVLAKHYNHATDLIIQELPPKPVGTNSYIANTAQCFVITQKEILKYQNYYFSELIDVQQEIRDVEKLSPKQENKIQNLCKILNIHYSDKQEMQALVMNLQKEELFQLVQEKITKIPRYTLTTPQAQQTFEEICEKLKTHTYLPELHTEKFKNIKFPQEPGKYAINTPKHTTFVTENYNTITKLITSIKQSKKI